MQVSMKGFAFLDFTLALYLPCLICSVANRIRPHYCAVLKKRSRRVTENLNEDNKALF